MESFYDWCVSKYKNKDTPRGDFAKDALRADDFPKDAETQEVILNYLRNRRACSEAIQVFKRLWKDYNKCEKNR